MKTWLITVVLQAVNADDTPRHPPLGTSAHSLDERKRPAFRSDIDITIATDFDQP